jgi:tetratricopeptide (TPR) repeat protein
MFGWFKKKSSSGDELNPSRALEYFSRGDFAEALRRGEMIVAAAPQVALSWRFKGECLFSLQRYPEAIECFDRAAAIGGEATEDMFLWKALSFYNDGKHEQARQVIRDFLASGAGTPQIRAQAQSALDKFEGRG